MNNKEIITKVYEIIFNGHSPEAAREYMKEDYIQHNPRVKTGREGFIEFFIEMFKRNPGFNFEIKHLVADGDIVVVHGHATGSQGGKGAAVADIYRLEKGKLAEHWDVLQQIPDEFVHKNGMF